MPTRGSATESGDDTGSPSTCEHGLREHEVEGAGDLEGLVISWHDNDPATDRLDETGIIGGRRVGIGRGMCRREHRASKALRCLDRTENCPVKSGLDDAVEIDRLDGVGHRKPGHHRVSATSHRSGHGINQGGWHQRPGGIMHEDNVNIRREDEQRSRHRGLSGISTRDHYRGSPPPSGIHKSVFGQQLFDVGYPLSGRSHHNEVDTVGGGQSSDRVHEHRHTSEMSQCFGGTRPETLAATGGGDDGSSATHRRNPAESVGFAKTSRPLAVVTTLVTTT